jgi:hypothetical protein
MYTWTYHLVARELQSQALEAEVGRIAYQLFHRPSPEEEVASLLTSFDLLRKQEKCESQSWKGLKGELARRDCRRMTNWTSVFHRRLMRQYQIAESLHRNPNDALAVYAAARYPWYAPMTEHPQWCAWAVILEMAIRRMSMAHLGKPPEGWLISTRELDVAEHASGPAVRFRANCGEFATAEPHVWRLLCIELGAERRLFPRNAPRGAFAALKPKIWELRPETIPWWTERDGRKPQETPSAREVWDWAFGAVRRNQADSANRLAVTELR